MAKVRLAKVSVEDLKKEIRRRHGILAKLMAARDALDRRIAELEGLGLAKPKAVARKKAGRKKAARRAVKPARAGRVSGTSTCCSSRAFWNSCSRARWRRRLSMV